MTTIRATTVRYFVFERKEGPLSEVTELMVPQLLAHKTREPLKYAQDVNDFEFCDIDGTKLVQNPEKTARIRREIIERSPRIMRNGDVLYLRAHGDDELIYQLFDGRLIDPVFPSDYVCGTIAAAGYLGMSHTAFNEFAHSGAIGIYRIRAKRSQLLNYPAYKPWLRVRLFLLEELNRKKNKK